VSRDRYFDNAATTPLDPRVLEAMLPWMQEDYGNANSIHSLGLKARDAVEKARAQVAEAIGAEDPSEIVFTSGATEANNWLLSAYPGAWVSPVEHSSIWEQVGPRGLQILTAPEGGGCIVPPGQLGSLMRVNNETGAIYEPPEAPLIHSDLTQAIGKVTTDLSRLHFATFSAHKFHGPKGIGALYARGANFPKPLLHGGEHEAGYRAGTLNVPAIVGMGEAIHISVDSEDHSAHHATHLKKVALEELEGISDWVANPAPGLAASFLGRPSPFILSLSFLGIEGETLVIELDRQGYAISSGAACSSRSTEPSHVLTAMGYPLEWIRGTIRISFGRYNTVEATQALAKALRSTVERLR